MVVHSTLTLLPVLPSKPRADLSVEGSPSVPVPIGDLFLQATPRLLRTDDVDQEEEDIEPARDQMMHPRHSSRLADAASPQTRTEGARERGSNRLVHQVGGSSKTSLLFPESLAPTPVAPNVGCRPLRWWPRPHSWGQKHPSVSLHQHLLRLHHTL